MVFFFFFLSEERRGNGEVIALRTSTSEGEALDHVIYCITSRTYLQ